MTDAELIAIGESSPHAVTLRMVRVVASDYSYLGRVASVFQKSSGKWRCVVEDIEGRLFIHNAGQLETR